MGATKDITLSTGEKVTVDVSTLKIKEWRDFWKPQTPDRDTDAVIARLTGLKEEAIPDLLRDDFRLIMDTIITLSNRPLDDPNSQGAST
jgi:hypothetical protein